MKGKREKGSEGSILKVVSALLSFLPSVLSSFDREPSFEKVPREARFVARVLVLGDRHRKEKPAWTPKVEALLLPIPQRRLRG
jgi:hypothetical protein